MFLTCLLILGLKTFHSFCFRENVIIFFIEISKKNILEKINFYIFFFIQLAISIDIQLHVFLKIFFMYIKTGTFD